MKYIFYIIFMTFDTHRPLPPSRIQHCPSSVLINLSDNSLDAKIDSLISSSGGGELVCLVCGKRSTVKQNMRNHVETHLEGVSFNCDICMKQYKTRNSLNVHKSLHHTNAYLQPQT